MKKTLLIAALAVFALLQKVEAQYYDFTSVAPSGQMLYYKINPDYSVNVVHPAYDAYSSYSWTGYTQPSGSVIIPDSVFYGAWNMWLPVTSIGPSAFWNCSAVTSVVLPSSIVTIGEFAFRLCGLTTISIQEGVDTINYWAFAQSSLTSISIPNSVKYIGGGCFIYCSNLNMVTLAGVYSNIYDQTFYGCTQLQSINIPSSVNKIGGEAFYQCTSLDSVVISDGVRIIGSRAFMGCSNLSYVSMPLGLNRIEGSAFSGCNNILSLTIPDSVVSIGENAFTGCSSLSAIIIPDRVDTIWENAFSDCTSLESVTIGSGLRFVLNKYKDNHNITRIEPGKCFTGCPSIKYLNINCNLEYYYSGYDQSQNPHTRMSIWRVFDFGSINNIVSVNYGDNVNNIESGDAHFTVINLFTSGGTSHLKRVQIGNSVTSIPQSFFKDCDSLVSIKIGTGVSYIGNEAFYHCTMLDTITTMRTSAPQLGDNVFTLTRPNKKVIIPCNSNYDTVWGTTGFVYITGGYSLSLASNNTDWGNAFFVQNVDCSQTAIIEATPTIGHRFVQWSDGNNDNPRTITLSQNTTLTAVFEAYNVNVSATSNNEMMGTVVGGGSIPVNGEVTLSASPACGHRFVMWNDSITSNPRTFIADKDTSFIAYFELAVDTIELHDTTYINVPMHDTTIITDTITVTEYVPVHDTTYIDVHDTTYINIPVHDTTVITDTVTLTEYVPVHDTAYIAVHDTTYINIPIHDTTIITDTVMLTEYVSVHDTTYINVHDTTYINVPVHDTTVVTDTVIVSVHDTTYITQTDTLTVTQYDTIDNYIHDTLTITDTLWLTQYDTILIHDTIFIHDTIVVGVGDVETVNAKIYTNNRQIVVEGADGNDVCLYDVNGRILAIKQDYGVPIRFDAPASGTYMIKIGDYPARKVVVIR